MPDDRRVPVRAEHDVRARELRPREAFHVEELRGTQVGVTFVRAGVDTGKVDPIATCERSGCS